MELSEIKIRKVYWHKGRSCFGEVVCCDPEDGASLLFEPLDDVGDIMGHDIFRCEASQLEEATKEKWNTVYCDEDCLTFEEATCYEI